MPLGDFLLIVGVLGGGAWLLTPLSRALAERVRGPGRAPAVPVDSERDAVAARLTELEREVVELHERLDFAERLLARQRQPERLTSGHAD